MCTGKYCFTKKALLDAFPWTLLTWKFSPWPFLPPLCGRFFPLCRFTVGDFSYSGHYRGRLFFIDGHFPRPFIPWTFLPIASEVMFIMWIFTSDKQLMEATTYIKSGHRNVPTSQQILKPLSLIPRTITGQMCEQRNINKL